MNHGPVLELPPTPRGARGASTVGAALEGDTVRTRTRPRKNTTRAKLKTTEQIKVWVRAGGQCALCKTYLLEGRLTGLGVSLGELAHVVGQQTSARSPRGHHPMERQDRDTAANVLLACASCHNEIDKDLVAGVVDVDVLMRLKREHEDHIRHVTALLPEQRTLVLRMMGDLRGNVVEIDRRTATSAVLQSGRFPMFDLDFNRVGVEIDIRGLPGEADAGPNYFAVACEAIDEVVEHKLRTAIRSGEVRHVSVFAFARLPLIVYLGARLEDNIPLECYQRHRGSQRWEWGVAHGAAHFTSALTGNFADAEQAVVVLNVSGTVNLSDLPDHLSPLPRILVAPDALPSPDVIRSRESLDAFCTSIREVNAFLDSLKTIRRLHVFGAVPPTAALEFGRLHDPHIHPVLVVYDRTLTGEYRPALEIA